MQHTPLISVHTPMSIPPSTPFAYPPGEMYGREQMAAVGLSFPRPVTLLEQQERVAELQRLMYHKQQQQQQHGMQIEGHMMSPAMLQHQYFQGMVTYPEFLAAAAAASGNSNEEAIIRQQRIMAAAAASQVAQPQTPNPDLNHFQFDPRVLMQYGAINHNQEEMYMIRAMEVKLVHFTQQLVMHQPSMLQPEFASELQKHCEMFRYLILQNPANQHNPVYQQIWQVLEHFTQQRAAMEQQHPVRTGVIVNSNH